MFVSGTTARFSDLEGDVYVQLSAAIRLVATALKGAGADLHHVVRTVVYVVDMDDDHHVARAHAEAFGTSRPTSTLVQVAALLRLRPGSKSK